MSYVALKTKQKGIGMPEVMVSMLLLGVAVIGFAALQVRALDSTNDAMFRTQAASIAQEMGERMRLNPAGEPTYRNNWNTTAVAEDKCFTAECTPVEMAQYDMRTMTKVAADTLPNGRLAVRPCINRTNLCVYVSWNETTPTIGSAAPNCSLNSDAYVPNADCIKLEG
jgi:type IV pilus assembly protein PilV